ncbi:MAG: site-specific DNA-methyltransferase [Chloroflexi bacterium]|nr:site-specific DNA-methyltransferase [Chloroflexota bacterium]
MNYIYQEDNLNVLEELHPNSVDLIYIDPPFNTGKSQSRTYIKVKQTPSGDRVGFKEQRYETINLGTKSYADNFGDEFLEFMEPRLQEARRVLSDRGALYFHIDYREVHYCRILLDKIFGPTNFLNEIIWAYDYGGKSKTRWPAKHDNILVYVKDPKQYIFNEHSFATHPKRKGSLRVSTADVWWHTIVPTASKEKTGYPTQKPLGIINPILEVSSNPGDVVLDFFAGSGTTGEACLRLGRKFILVDNNHQAIEVMKKRFGARDDITWYSSL